MKSLSKIKLHLCLDWDLTLINFHTAGVYNKLDESHFNEITRLCEILSGYIEAGHSVSIVTHGGSVDMIKQGLGIIGLSLEQIEKVAISSGYRSGDKSDHIIEAQEFHALQEPFRTLLVDDDGTNLRQASRDGRAILKVIGVDEGKNSHLEALEKALKFPSSIDTICKKHAEKEGYLGLLKPSFRDRT